MHTRAKLQRLYGDEQTADGKIHASTKVRAGSVEELRGQKRKILDEMQAQYARIKSDWGGDTEYDGWFAHPVNNAQLNSVAAYYDFVPGFEQLLSANGGDMDKFYSAAERISKRPKNDRHEELRILARTRRGPVRAEGGQSLATARQ
jgi:predicted aminopeptidase